MPKFKNVEFRNCMVKEIPDGYYDMVIQDFSHERISAKLDSLTDRQLNMYLEGLLSKAKEMGTMVVVFSKAQTKRLWRHLFTHRHFSLLAFDYEIFFISFAPRYDNFNSVSFKRMTPQNSEQLFKPVIDSHSHCRKILDVEPRDKTLGRLFYGKSGYEYLCISSDLKFITKPFTI